jgi:hypothetical protein
MAARYSVPVQYQAIGMYRAFLKHLHKTCRLIKLAGQIASNSSYCDKLSNT